MGTISLIALLKTGIKMGLFIGGVLGCAAALNYLHTKKFKKVGANKHESDIDSAGSIGIR